MGLGTPHFEADVAAVATPAVDMIASAVEEGSAAVQLIHKALAE